MIKNDILKIFAILMAGCAMLVSCQPEGPENDGSDVIPVFPEPVKDMNVAPGSTLTLTFDVNMDWELAISDTNIRWFWIDDNSIRLDKISGKVAAAGEAEEVTVHIGVSDVQEFDENRTCTVTLTMGGESRMIAEYMRQAKSRTLAVYAAKVENGEFLRDDVGAFIYDEEKEAEGLDLIWSAEYPGIIMPFKVVSNCDWTIEAPEWLSFQEPDEISEIVEIVFSAASLEAVQGNVTFKAKDGDAEVKTYEVSAPACAEVSLYAAVLDERGEFMFDEQGEYIYSDAPDETVTLVWPGQDYRLPVRIDAKCNWTVELPEWLEIRYSDEEILDRTGTVSCTLIGDPMSYPLDEVTEDIVFKFADKEIQKVSVTIPGVKDIFSFGVDMAMTSWEFNAAGQVLTSVGYQDVAASAWFYGLEDATVAVVEMKDGKRVAENPSWIDIELQAYDEDGEVLQNRAVTIIPEENDSWERSALVLFCQHAYAAEEWFASDGTLLEDKKSYAVELLQHGSDVDYITMLLSDAQLKEAGAKFAVSTNPRLDVYFGTAKYKYTLTYSNPYAGSEARMSLAKPYKSVKVFNAARKEVTSSDFWLRFTSEDMVTGVVDMYADMTPSEKATTGYIVFYDEDDSVLAILECIFDPVVEVITLDVGFTDESVAIAESVGATLVQLKEGDIYDLYFEGMNIVYHLTYKTTDTPLKIRIPDTVKKHIVNPYDYMTYFRVNGMVYNEYLGPNDMVGEVVTDENGAVEISMERPDKYVQIGKLELPADTYMGSINFLDASDKIIFILVCTLDLSK